MIDYLRDQLIVIFTYFIAILAGFGTLFMASQVDHSSTMKIMIYSFLASSFTTYFMVLLEAKTE